METKRLFIGTYINNDVFKYTYDDIKDDFHNAIFGKWVELSNLHFTFKFLGDVNIDEIHKIKDELSDLLVTYDYTLQFIGLGAFPTLANPRVLYANIIDSNNLLENINNRIEKRLFQFGFLADDKVFNPHLTLIRIKEYNKSEFKKSIEKYKSYKFGEMDSFKVALIESKLTPKGPIYNII